MKILVNVFAVILAFATPALHAAHHEGGHGAAHSMPKAEGTRAVVAMIEAEIAAIDLETKEVTLVGPQGQHVTIVAQEKIVTLSDLSVGDRVAAEYLASLHGEVREPTEEELANPWIVLEDGVIDENPAHPAIGAARQIRAVCSIEAFDAATGFVMIKDSRGKMHTVEGIPAVKFEGISLGETLVVVYTEALAIAIQKISEAGM
ncbi:MAG: hypothetical protein P8O91_09560 [Luminiphilus sp.]|nr:hypothetical protein [Luminiphilus sp.]